MVCIDEVVAYFKTLKSYERLWMMCRLQSHCLPIELRYLGTCLDNLSKRDIHILKKLELEANDPANVSEVACKCICDRTVRAAVIKYLSVLNTNSTKCSELIYKALTDDQGLERIFKFPKAFFNDKNAFEELMVLYTLAVNHPAFLFEQKTRLDNIFNSIKKEKERQLLKNNNADQDDSSDTIQNINTMIPPPNCMYQQPHGASNFPLNRNGYLYPRHYYQFPPMNVPPMQVCYDYPPPPVIPAIRGPHPANFPKSQSPVSWPPRTFQLNLRNQPPNNNSKHRHPTPRFHTSMETLYPYAHSWNNWNMYQLSSQNMYNNYNYTPGMVPSHYPENVRNYQGHGIKNKHQNVNRPVQPASVSTTPNKINPVAKTADPVLTDATANSSNENISVLDTPKQIPSSSKSPEEAYNENGSPKTSDLSISSDKVSAASPQPAVQNNVDHTPSKSGQPIAQLPNADAKVFIPDNKTNPESSAQTSSKCQPTLPKTCSPPTNSQQTPQHMDSKVASVNEPTKDIDLSSLSAALNDEKNKEEETSTAVSSDVIVDETSMSSSEQKPLEIPLQSETNTITEQEVNESVVGGAMVKPINTPVTTNSFSTQATKYHKGRQVQSQSRAMRDGNLNTSFNRKHMAGGPLIASYPEHLRENVHNSHPKLPNNGQQYYTMSYDNGASARPYNTQTYYVHPPQTSQQVPTSFSAMPRSSYMQTQHVVQSPEYQQVYQQPTEYVYYPSSSQAYYTTPVLMQPQVLAYHPPKVSCYNCGGQNHTGVECTELTMEEITNKGLYENHYGPSMPDGRPRN